MVLLLVVIQVVNHIIKLRFEGDIAQASSITYQQGAVLLDDTQVGLMVRDPEKYLRDYKVGTSSRRPYFDTTQNFKSILKTTISKQHKYGSWVIVIMMTLVNLAIGGDSGEGVKTL